MGWDAFDCGEGTRGVGLGRWAGVKSWSRIAKSRRVAVPPGSQYMAAGKSSSYARFH